MTTTKSTTQVITFALCYEQGQDVTLCATCEHEWEDRLGEVQHGEHEGECEGCYAEGEEG